MAPGPEREDRGVSNCLVHVHWQPEDRADRRRRTDIASGTRLGKLSLGHEPDMRSAKHAASLGQVEVTVCVEDHERAPPVVGQDPDHLGEGSRADVVRTSGLSCGERRRMLMELVLDAVLL